MKKTLKELIVENRTQKDFNSELDPLHYISSSGSTVTCHIQNDKYSHLLKKKVLHSFLEEMISNWILI